MLFLTPPDVATGSSASMPDARKVANKYSHITLDEVRMLLHSKIHEERMLAVLILLLNAKTILPALQNSKSNI
jgi:hypothetical protein